MAAAAKQWHTIQDFVPLRESILWDLQASFYDKINIKCWANSIVPNFVTSNCFIAHCYSRAVLGFIRDWFLRSPHAVQEEPIYVVEIGAGHGKMSFLMLKTLAAMKEVWPHTTAFPFKYVITDFTQHNLDFWRHHESFASFIDEGIMDIAIFDADSTADLELQVSGTVLSRKSCANPVVALCNYIFDTLRQDAFRIVDGELQEALCSVLSPQVEEDPTAPGVIARMSCRWDYRKCTPEIYEDEHMQNVLRSYLAQKRNMSILIPVGGIGVINKLASLSDGKVFLLAGDKAYNHDASLAGLRAPHIAVHGSFSFMVNFDAVRLNVLSRGGFSLRTPYLDGFKCSAFCVGCGDSKLFPELRAAWHDYFMRFGPENFSTLQRCVKDETGAASLKTALTVLRLSRYDSDIFFKFRQVFLQRTPEASDKIVDDTIRDLEKMYTNYYPLQRNKDISFEFAHLLMTLQLYEEAIQYFKLSQKHCGEHHISWYNMGICYHFLEDPRRALVCFDTCLRMQPKYHEALGWKKRAELGVQELAAREESTAPSSEVVGIEDVSLVPGGAGHEDAAGTGSNADTQQATTSHASDQPAPVAGDDASTAVPAPPAVPAPAAVPVADSELAAAPVDFST